MHSFMPEPRGNLAQHGLRVQQLEAKRALPRLQTREVQKVLHQAGQTQTFARHHAVVLAFALFRTDAPTLEKVHQLAQTVADTPGLHGKPYQGVLLLQVEDLSNSETQKKITEALKDTKGISAAPVDDKTGILGITFDKLEPTQGMGVRLEEILGKLTAAGIKATPYMPKET